jgi:hypothetical protein
MNKQIKRQYFLKQLLITSKNEIHSRTYYSEYLKLFSVSGVWTFLTSHVNCACLYQHMYTILNMWKGTVLVSEDDKHTDPEGSKN